MQFITTTSFKRFVGGMVLVGAALPALAVSTWNMGGGCSDPNSAAFGNTYTCTSPTLDATATAWATSGASYTAASTFSAAYLSPNGSAGFGVKNQVEGLNVSAPDHALDNNGQTDAMLLNFGKGNEVSLTSISLGYINSDSDLSLLRYTSVVSGAATAPAIAGKTISGLLSDGWELVGSYANLANGANAVNGTALSSSWWLISAYNVNYGTTGSGNGTGSKSSNFDTTADYVKLMTVAGDVTKLADRAVPEPGSLALAGVAFVGLLGVSRRKVSTR